MEHIYPRKKFKSILMIEDFYSADEIWMTGTTTEITPIIAVDGNKIGNGAPGAAARTLQKKFREVTKSF